MGGICSKKQYVDGGEENAKPTLGLRALSSDLSVSGRYHNHPQKIEDDYKVSESDILGTGYNGSVFKAHSKHRDGVYAVKGFRLDGISAAKKAELRGEVQIFLAMDHPHVARLVDVYEDPAQLYLVMECMEGGELFERVQKMKTFSEKESAHSVWQMLLSVNYIHSHGVVHRDLKLENFLFERKDNDHLKLIDFGFSKVFDDETKMDLSCGTLAYCAPDVLQRSYTSQCDLWSMGVITFILLLGYMPFSGTEEAQKSHIMTGTFKKKKPHWDKISKMSQDFVRSLIEVDPSKRLTAEQALKHPWVAKRDQTGRRYVTPLGELADGGEDRMATLNVDDETMGALCCFAQASRFRRACMSLMAWSLTAEERSQVRDTFIELDTDRQGTIKLSDFKNVLMSKFNLDEERTDTIVTSLAVTQKDVIHYSEFLAAMVSTRMVALNDEHYMATFRRFDGQKRGFVTDKDLKKVLGDGFSIEELEQIAGSIDTSGKGEITFDAFRSYLQGGDNGRASSEGTASMEISQSEDDPDRTQSSKTDETEQKEVSAFHKMIMKDQGGEGDSPTRLISGAAPGHGRVAGTPKEVEKPSKACCVQ